VRPRRAQAKATQWKIHGMDRTSRFEWETIQMPGAAADRSSPYALICCDDNLRSMTPSDRRCSDY
jgi:hypothetical protein